jgi:serine/threonine protein kinase
MLKQTEPIPGYRLIERLGRGGYGEVWKAEAPGGIFKAIKFVYGDLDSTNEDAKGAEQELKALNRVKTIRHPYILSIERFDVVEGQLLIVMELADRNLWDRFKECKDSGLPGIPREELLGYTAETCEALDLMNLQYQIQHLDIKPQNLFLVHNHVKVADFGLAKDFEGLRATITGGVTPIYAPPETFEGWISRHSDQYSLAIVFQELLTGFRPFSGTNTRQLLMQHVSSPPDLSPLCEADRETIGRALSKKPGDRFPTCMEFYHALVSGAGTSPAGANSTTTPPPLSMTPSPNAPTLLPGHRLRNGASDSKSVATPLPVSTDFSTGSGSRPGLRGLPALITPSGSQSGLATPSGSAAVSAPATMQRPSFMTGRVSKLGIAGPEKQGQGVLTPAYFVAVGNLGLQTMLRLRGYLNDRYGRKSLPHFRWLFMDTDPTTINAALNAPSHQALDRTEILAIPLQRPVHYLRRENVPPFDTWLSPELLFRMPRDPLTNGIRALGRLAFCDHYSIIARRTREDLESFLTDEPLQEAEQLTQLGMRGNRPRVFVLSSLFGGTGSGVLIDLAYVIRQEMRQLGFLKPSVTGVFFVPPVDKNSPKNLAIANTRATLIELNHFSRPGQRYETRFDTRQSPVIDLDRPFERAMLFNLPKNEDQRKASSSVELAAGLLMVDNLSTVGRALERSRTRAVEEHPLRGLPLQSAALYRMIWPRKLLQEQAVYMVIQTILQRLQDKEAGRVQKRVEAWIAEEWQRRQLNALDVGAKLAALVETHLKGRPESQFAERLQVPTDAELQKTACAAFDEILRIVGRPGQDEENNPGKLVTDLETIARPLAKECEVRVAEMAVYFIEQPDFRFIGAEEAIRCLRELLNTELEGLERRCQEWRVELDVEFHRLLGLIGSLPTNEGPKAIARRSSAHGDLFEQLLSWTIRRYRLVLTRALSGIYRRISGNIPEYLREVNFCRHQLQEFQSKLPKESKLDPLPANTEPILPDGCRTVVDAANKLITAVSPDEWFTLEQQIQSQVRRQFRAMLHVCVKIRENGPRFLEILTEHAREFVEPRLGRMSATEAFFTLKTDTQGLQRGILNASDQAIPDRFGGKTPQIGSFVVGIPKEQAGERFQQAAAAILKDQTFVPLPAGDDQIIFCREQHQLPISDLPQAGALAEEAVRHVLETEKTPAHSRADIAWLPIARD